MTSLGPDPWLGQTDVNSAHFINRKQSTLKIYCGPTTCQSNPPPPWYANLSNKKKLKAPPPSELSSVSNKKQQKKVLGNHNFWLPSGTSLQWSMEELQPRGGYSIIPWSEKLGWWRHHQLISMNVGVARNSNLHQLMKVCVFYQRQRLQSRSNGGLRLRLVWITEGTLK